MKTTWRKLISEEMEKRGDSWSTLTTCTLSEKEIDVEFDNGYGGSEGKPFRLWTKARVYFPAVYDGHEWVESVPRDPVVEPISHVGGE